MRHRRRSKAFTKYKYIDQLYYEVNKDIILGRQMPVAVVAMKPEVFILEPINFWDWGVIYDYCPSKKIKCLGDSDEFLMLELRHAMTQFDNILNHRIDLEYSANLMSGHLTEYQYDFLKFNLVLHSIDLPNNFKEIESQFAAEVDKYSATLVTVINKLNNSQWNYHHKYFNFYNKTRYRRLRLEKINKIIQDVKDGVENINTITLEKEYKILEKQIEEEKITLNLILDLKPLNSAPLKSKMNSINFLNRINRYLNFINRYLYKKLKLKTLKKLDNLINNAVEKNLYPKLNHNFKYKVEVLGSDENINVLVKSSKNAFIDFTNTSVLINDYKVDSLDKKCNITCFIILDKDEANIINYFSLFKFIKSKSNVFILIFNNHNFKSIEFTKKFNIFNKGYEVFLNKNVKIYNNLYFLIFINLLKLLLLFLFRDEKVNFSITKIQVKKIR